MRTRRALLVQLRKCPGSTVADLAEHFAISGEAVRRHLDALAARGLVESVADSNHRVGRPASVWRLTGRGMELFPRRYGDLALELLDDLGDAAEDLLHRRHRREVDSYLSDLEGLDDLGDRVTALTARRDGDGFLAEVTEADDGSYLLTQNNCALHVVAERHRCLCTMELELLQTAVGDGAVVERVEHALDGDGVCSYRICPAATTPAAPA